MCELAFYPRSGNAYPESTPSRGLYTATYTAILNGRDVVNGNGGTISLDTDQDNIQDIKLNPSLPIEFDIPLTIDTGGEFGKTYLYSNYKVVLTVYLESGGSPIPGSRASDYIIYTNAKILTTLVEPVATTTP